MQLRFLHALHTSRSNPDEDSICDFKEILRLKQRYSSYQRESRELEGGSDRLVKNIENLYQYSNSIIIMDFINSMPKSLL